MLLEIQICAVKCKADGSKYTGMHCAQGLRALPNTAIHPKNEFKGNPIKTPGGLNPPGLIAGINA